jgi:phosphatidylglycerol:prolipoprotein diacylglycerol transferase
MYPILLQIGSFTLSSIWVLFGLSLFASLIIVNKMAKFRLVKLNFLAENSLLIFLCGLIGARLVFLVYNYQSYWNEISSNSNILSIFHIWDKGLSVWGGLVGVFLSLYILAKKQHEDFKSWADIVIVSAFYGMILTHIGAFLDGRNSGAPTDLPWGVLVENSQYAVPIHPVQLYAAIYSALIATLLTILFKKKKFKKPGFISLIGITCYSFFRFLEEFLRGDESHLIFGVIREAQIYAFLGIAIGLYFLYKYQQSSNKEEN